MKWYVKEFSKLTKVSVRTLHHYDDIGLLKPSLRSSGNYRLYSETDLLKLERIIALKFFGFSLQQITVLVGKDVDVVEHLKAQQACLNVQIQHLHQAVEIINQLAQSTSKSIEWSKIVTLLEVFRMTKELSNTWTGQVFSPDQLKQLAQLKQRFTEHELAEYTKQWGPLIEKVKSNLDKDPHSKIGQQLAKEWMDHFDKAYFDYPELKDALSIAYKYNKIPHAPFDQKVWDFVEKAVTFMESKKK